MKIDKIWSLVLAFFLAICLWVLVFYLVYSNLDLWNDPEKFRDSFSAVNALFSGLAFAGIIFTILLQRKELMIQRQEFLDARMQIQRTLAEKKKEEEMIQQQIQTMNTTSKLTALNALIEAYNEESDSEESFPLKKLKQMQKDELIHEIELILNEIKGKEEKNTSSTQ